MEKLRGANTKARPVQAVLLFYSLLSFSSLDYSASQWGTPATLPSLKWVSVVTSAAVAEVLNKPLPTGGITRLPINASAWLRAAGAHHVSRVRRFGNRYLVLGRQQVHEGKRTAGNGGNRIAVGILHGIAGHIGEGYFHPGAHQREFFAAIFNGYAALGVEAARSFNGTLVAGIPRLNPRRSIGIYVYYDIQGERKSVGLSVGKAAR